MNCRGSKFLSEFWKASTMGLNNINKYLTWRCADQIIVIEFWKKNWIISKWASKKRARHDERLTGEMNVSGRTLAFIPIPERVAFYRANVLAGNSNFVREIQKFQKIVFCRVVALVTISIFCVNLEAESHTVRSLQTINARLIILRSKIGSRPIFQKFAFLAAGTAHNKETTR